MMEPPRSSHSGGSGGKADGGDDDAVLDRFWHLSATPHEMAVTELEYAAIRMLEAFNRWIVQGSAALGAVDISYAEATLLHIVRLQDRPKSLTTIARLLNRDDTPNIQYGLRKLANAGLIEKKRDPARKTFLYQVTQKGREITDAYARMRREVLMPLTEAIDHTDDRLSAASEFLQIMTGLYDAAGRVAATYQAADHRRRPSANFGKASGKKPV